MIKIKLITEQKDLLLLNEEVFGAQAFVYHGSHQAPSKFIDILVKDKFKPGSGAGISYGMGLYTVRDLEGTQTNLGEYGDYIYKLKVNLYGFIIFDEDVALKVYGKPLTPAQQAKLLGKKQQIIKNIENLDLTKDYIIKFGNEIIRFPAARTASRFLKGKVKGIVYTDYEDGKCVLIYDSSMAVPVGWKYVGEKEWHKLDIDYIKPMLDRTVHHDWKESKYEKTKEDEERIFTILKGLEKAPINKRIIPHYLNLSKTEITSLPAGLKAKRGLSLSDTPITSLPQGLHVGGHLNLAGCKNISSLPEDLFVDGDLYIEDSGIASLPKRMTVTGNLYISGDNKITSLPDGFSISGDLILSEPNFNSLPSGLTVGGNLVIYKPKFNYLPNGLVVGENLIIRDTTIKSLPEDIQVGGKIFINYKQIRKKRHQSNDKDKINNRIN